MPDTAVAERSSPTPELRDPGDLARSGNSTPVLIPTSHKEVAPADCVPEPRWWERLAWYSGAALLTCVLIFWGIRLDQADLHAPFYYDLDSLLILPMVKSTIERGPGGHWHNDHLGLPGSLDLHDFPVIDHLHFLLIWLMSKVVTNLIVVYNLYFLLTFPLTTLTAMAVFRQLRLTLPAAAVGGLLYSFLPYHYQRWENHYFLAAYWLVPLSLLPVFAICKGYLPFFSRQPDGSNRWRLLSWSSAGQVLLAAATASAGAYYAFFTCAFIAFAGVYRFAWDRKWPVLTSSGLVVAAIVGFGIVNHLPTFVYQAKYGRNPVTERYPEESDFYGLKLAHLILPIEDHNLHYLARLKWFYNSNQRPAENENKSASLGIVGVVGLFWLLTVILLQRRMGWPYGPLAALTAFGILLATIGGFGSVFNLLITSQIRGYNRISVFLAFFCFLTTLWVIDWFLVQKRRTIDLLYLSYTLLPVWGVLLICRTVSNDWRKRVDRIREQLSPHSVSAHWFVWSGVLIVGFLDQTPYSWFKSEIVQTISEQANRFRADARFFSEIERTMTAGPSASADMPAIFCLPYVFFPESPPVGRMPAYEHIRGFIHTDGLAWSYGSMKGREADAWQLEVSYRGTEEMLQRIVYRGFEGLLIDKRGYPTLKDSTNKALTVINDVNSIYASLVKKRNARLPEVVHEDGQQFFLDLRPYREALEKASPELFALKTQEEREWAAVLWLGFYSPGLPYDDRTMRFGPPDGEIRIVNPSDRTRTFTLSMTLAPLGTGPFAFELTGLVNEEFALERKTGDWDFKRDGIEKRYRLEVPPGQHAIRIRCRPPSDFIPFDVRKLYYFIKDYKLEEVR